MQENGAENLNPKPKRESSCYLVDFFFVLPFLLLGLSIGEEEKESMLKVGQHSAYPNVGVKQSAL